MIKKHTTTEIIAKEGWWYVFFSTLFFLIALFVGFLPWVFFFIMILTGYIYRNPERIPVEEDKMSLLSPMDGKITDISKVRVKDGKEFLKLEIRKNVFNVILLRSPISLTITDTKRIHGLFLDTSSDLHKKIGEKAILTCKGEVSDIVMIIYAGIFNRKIELFKTIGPLRFASRFGSMLDGSMELLLPVDTRIKVSLGDEVKAGESVLGYFSYENILNEQ